MSNTTPTRISGILAIVMSFILAFVCAIGAELILNGSGWVVGAIVCMIGIIVFHAAGWIPSHWLFGRR